jgi:transcriptional regulator with XRE-family HTH domain
MEINYVSLGKNIKKHRALAEMTQEKLAEFAGCTDRHIGQIEGGKNVPSLAVVVAIANALNVGIDQLLYGDLQNRTNYFIQELASLTEGFEAKEKLMAIEMTKALMAIIKEFKMK